MNVPMPEAFALLVIAWAAVVGIIWLVIGWRAMVAHESIARSLDRWVNGGGTGTPRDPNAGPRTYSEKIDDMMKADADRKP